MENARAFPSASVSGGSIQVISANWPALNSNPSGLVKSNAIVRQFRAWVRHRFAGGGATGNP